MTNILEYLPPFLTEALQAPLTWNFWEWVGAVGALISIAIFAKALGLALLRMLGQILLPPLEFWGGKLSLWSVSERTRYLVRDMEAAMLWYRQPQRLIAFVVRVAILAMTYFAVGSVALLTLPEGFNLALGIPLIGKALLGFAFLRGKMLLIADCPKYVAKKKEAIEKTLDQAEVFFDDKEDKPKAMEAMEAIRRQLAAIEKIASDIGDTGRENLTQLDTRNPDGC